LVFTLLLVVLTTLNVAVAVEQGYCVLTPTTLGSAVSGTLSFSTSNGQVSVTANIVGLPGSTSFGIHVHTYGDISDTTTGNSAGGHFVGNGATTHGCPPSANRHAGDMGNWNANAGSISQTKSFDIMQLTGDNSIIGRAVVVHSGTDDCATQPTGNSGSRLAFCVIGVQSTTDTNNAASTSSTSRAVCQLKGTSYCPGCAGQVWLAQDGSDVQVTAKVTGLALNSAHGFHIHQYGDLSKADATALGAHWNPSGSPHAFPDDRDHHDGDMGNIQSYDLITGAAWYRHSLHKITLGDTLGRGIVVHELFDHGSGYNCSATGNSGNRFAACVIGFANSSIVIPDIPSTVSLNNNFENVDCGNSASSVAPLLALVMIIIAYLM